MGKIVSPNGQMVEAKQLNFEVLKEDWNVYRLEDGTVYKIKPQFRSRLN